MELQCPFLTKPFNLYNIFLFNWFLNAIVYMWAADHILKKLIGKITLNNELLISVSATDEDFYSSLAQMAGDGFDDDDDADEVRDLSFRNFSGQVILKYLLYMYGFLYRGISVFWEAQWPNG